MIPEIIQAVTALGMLLSGIASILAWTQSRRNARTIEAVHLATNSMKDALVATTEKESFARGVKSGEASSMNINHRVNPEGPS